MIQLSNIKYSYPNSDFHLAIKSMQIDRGHKTAIIGPSGFGKTTLLNLIAGILLPREGEISVNDEAINILNDQERRNYRVNKIGFVFQDFKLLDYLNVYDNILLPFRINTSMQVNNDIKKSADDIAQSLNIGDKLYKHPSKLSHGERQRVAICRALLNQPQVILADEPTGNLDPENKSHIMNILFKYVQNYQSTLVTVTHDHELLKGFDRVIDFQKLT